MWSPDIYCPFDRLLKKKKSKSLFHIWAFFLDISTLPNVTNKRTNRQTNKCKTIGLAD